MSSSSKIQTVVIPDSGYLSQTSALDDAFANEEPVILVAPPGTGKSFAVLSYLKRKSLSFVFAADTLPLALQLGDEHSLPVYHAGNRSVQGEQVVTVQNHVQTLANKDCILVLDEVHSLITDYDPGFRQETVRTVQKAIKDYRTVVGLTACPIGIADDWRVIQGVTNRPTPVVAIKSYKSVVGGVVGEILARPKDRHFISIFDKNREAKAIMKSLAARYPGDALLQMNADTKADKIPLEVFRTGFVPDTIRVVVCTYRQGFSMRDSDFVCHLVPTARVRHSPEDILQVSQRFRKGARETLLYANLEPDPREWPFPERNARSQLEEKANKYSIELRCMWEKHLTVAHSRVKPGNYLQARVYDGTYPAEIAILLDGDLCPDPLGIEHLLYKTRSSAAYMTLGSLTGELERLGIGCVVAGSAVEQSSVAKTDAGLSPISKSEMKAMLSVFSKRLFEQPPEGASEIERIVKDRFDQLAVKFGSIEAAEELLLEYGRSGRTWKRLLRRIAYQTSTAPDLQKARKRMLSEFRLGGEYAPADVHKRVRRALRGQPTLKSHATPKQKAVEYFRDHFAVKRSNKKGVGNVYTVIGESAIGYDPGSWK